MNISTNITTVAKAVPGQVARSPSTTTSATASTNGLRADPTGETPRANQDTLDISTRAMRLAQSLAAEDARKQASETETPKVDPLPKSEATRSEPEPKATEKESIWESSRKAKLDRLETLVRQGLYKVDPFMLDEIAVRMAKLMD